MNWSRTFYYACKTAFIVFLLAASFGLFAQGKAVRGNVADAEGMPVIGASVSVKGTSVGTITDQHGSFHLNMPDENAVVVVSCIGYKPQEIPASGDADLFITLHEDNQLLEETVVVGYGSQRKLTVSGSVVSVGAKELSRSIAPTTAAALVGKVPGVTYRQVNGQPGQTTRIEIRNMGTPLFIIDGVMKDEGQFNNIDVNDIESISLLKDGAASVYGVRAANGVVLVTTKRGRLKEKATVSVNAYYGIQNWTRFPKLSNAYDYKRSISEAHVNTNGVSHPLVDTYENLEKWRTGYYNKETGEDYRGFDWYEFATKSNAPQYYLNVSSTGGSDRTNYYMSVGRMVQESVFPDFEFNRSNVQLNLDTRINDYIKVGASMNGRIETRLSPTISGLDETYSTDNYSTDYWMMRWGLNLNKPTERPYANDNPQYINQIGNNLTNQAYGRRDIIGGRDNVWRVFQGNWDIDIKTPLKGLGVNFLYSFYIANEQEEVQRKEVSFYKYDRVNDLYISTDDKGDPITSGSPFLAKKQHTIWENMYRFSINYDNKFGGGDHHVSGSFIAEASERFNKNMRVANTEITNNFTHLFSTDDANKILLDTYSVVPRLGYIARLNYNYRDKYIVELTGRYDGSFKFPKDKRWGLFPSVSAAWRVSEEGFFRQSSLNSWLTNLKLRASYGEMGDENVVADFAYLGGYDAQKYGAVISNDPFNSNTGTTIQVITQRGIPITNITWITASITNAGIDLGFLNNRLAVEMDGFYRKRSGLAADRDDVYLPAETGSSLPPENLDTDMHMGVDGAFKWRDRIGELQYFAGANITFARKRNGESYGERFPTSWHEYRHSTQNRWANVNWGYEVIGRFQTQEEIDSYPVIMEVTNGSDRNINILPGDLIYKDQNGDGVINDYDRRPIGYAENSLPYLTFAINFGLEWKGIDVAVDFAGAGMQSFQQDYETKWPFQADGNTFEFMVNDRWHHADPLDPSSPWVGGYYPALRVTPTDSWHVYCSNSTFWLTNVRYLRLRNLEIGYSIPEKIIRKVLMQRCRIYFNGTNLFSLDNLRKIGLDPENNDTNGLGYPNNRVLTLGVNLTF